MNGIIESIYSFDHSVLLYIQENLRFGPLTTLMKGVSFTVNIGFLWVVLSLVLLCFKKTRLMGAVALTSLAVGLLVNNVVIKPLVDRTRPYELYSDLVPLIAKPYDSSFASGHTTASFAAAAVYARFLNKPLAVLAVCYAVLVGLSRLYLGVHYPTDVLCGCLIGISASLIAYWIYSKKFDLKSAKLRGGEKKKIEISDSFSE